ncbi:MAG: helix-turn-helix domain-containing protein [Bacteroidales bacterium]|nr:helix-turn-helix domain-containing protein [Bacteroidales bacterium]MDD3665393.1 helix-turn-helix domain-containing protein [Bacteroidales bacterium]
MIERKNTGLFLPIEIVDSKLLNHTEMIFLGIIHGLSNNPKGCYARNAYFAEKLRIDERNVRVALSKLIDLGFVRVENRGGKNRVLFSTLHETIPGCYHPGNPDDNIRATRMKSSGLHNIYNDNIKDVSLNDKSDEERELLKKHFMDAYKDCNKQKHLITIEEKKQRLNSIVKAFTKESDFIEAGLRRFPIVESELMTSLKKFLDTINADDSCYDDFYKLRRRAVAYITKQRENTVNLR